PQDPDFDETRRLSRWRHPSPRSRGGGMKIPFKAIRTLLDHYEDDERNHWEAWINTPESERGGRIDDHIYITMAEIRDWLALCGEDQPPDGNPTILDAG